MKKSSPGFTMLELIVAIAVGAIVMAAALSFLLLGTRMERRSMDTAENQQTARIVLTMTEKMAISGDIKKVDKIGESWVLYSEDNKPLLQYLSADGSLRLGDSILMRNLQGATATFDENNPKLFTLTLTTEYDSFSITVYCRNGEIVREEITEEELLDHTKHNEAFDAEATKEGRLALLSALCEQYGSKGEIKGHDKTPEAPWAYFSEWYIRQQAADYPYGEANGWNEYTPWCACFLSWAFAKDGIATYLQAADPAIPYFADVDAGADYFKNIHEDGSHWLDNTVTPLPSDIVFFSWDGDDDPEHVGAVLHVDEHNVYTIEGNSSGKVTVNKYPLTSEDIIGYGVLAWQ